MIERSGRQPHRRKMMANFAMLLPIASFATDIPVGSFLFGGVTNVGLG
jgi:hypothetical protein